MSEASSDGAVNARKAGFSSALRATLKFADGLGDFRNVGDADAPLVAAYFEGQRVADAEFSRDRTAGTFAIF